MGGVVEWKFYREEIEVFEGELYNDSGSHIKWMSLWSRWLMIGLRDEERWKEEGKQSGRCGGT